MPIYHGSNKIKTIYYGSHKISKVYKGSTLVYQSVQMVTLTVNPTYSSATVTFNTAGTVSGHTITVPAGTTVSYTLSAANHDTITYTQLVNANMTVTPQIKRTHIAPSYYYAAGVCYNTTSIATAGQCLQGGRYTYTRGGNTNTWTVTVNSNGGLTRITATGNIRTRTAGGPTSIAPTGGWRYNDIWD